MNPPQGTAALITESLVVYKGVTDADGNAAKTTLLCSAIGSASAYPNFDGNQIILTSGSYKGQARDINGATNGDAVATITVANAFDGKIVSGTSFIITGIRTVPAEVAALQADVGDFSAQSNLKSLLAVLGGGWNTANKDMYTLLYTDLLGHATNGLANIAAQTEEKVAGRPQVFVKSITSAANAGDVTVATITTQPCIIDSIIIHADTAAQTDLTSAAISGGASKVVTFINATDAAKANIDAIDEQVSWTGAALLAATKTIVISLVGAGATVVDLSIIITFHSEVDGGYLV